jgi:hypothetical protein
VGYIIFVDKLSADSQGIEATLNYATPRNQKQLKRFLVVTNFHQRFVIKYAHYVAPLLSLLGKSSKRRWSEDMQKAVVTVRDMLALTIRLMHPDDELPYIINTDACQPACGSRNR